MPESFTWRESSYLVINWQSFPIKNEELHKTCVLQLLSLSGKYLLTSPCPTMEERR